MGLIDSHAHLTDPELFDQIEDVLARCGEKGVERVITIGTALGDAERAIELSVRFPDRIRAGVGFHPHEADAVTEDDLTAMARFWDHPSVVALGEMGLDYHYDLADRTRQRSVFARQLELACGRCDPIVVHCREAFDDAIPILLDRGFENRPVVFHCFTGTADEASRLAGHGWRLSFTGIVTFPKSVELQAIARSYPADRLMVETDSPYLSPVPVRSRRPNEPAHVVHVAGFLAALREVSYEQTVEQTAKNTRAFFNL